MWPLPIQERCTCGRQTETTWPAFWSSLTKEWMYGEECGDGGPSSLLTKMCMIVNAGPLWSELGVSRARDLVSRRCERNSGVSGRKARQLKALGCPDSWEWISVTSF